jgi:hypothetical protein
MTRSSASNWTTSREPRCSLLRCGSRRHRRGTSRSCWVARCRSLLTPSFQHPGCDYGALAPIGNAVLLSLGRFIFRPVGGRGLRNQFPNLRGHPKASMRERKTKTTGALAGTSCDGASRARTGDLVGAIRANLVSSSALRFVHALDQAGFSVRLAQFGSWTSRSTYEFSSESRRSIRCCAPASSSSSATAAARIHKSTDCVWARSDVARFAARSRYSSARGRSPPRA